MALTVPNIQSSPTFDGQSIDDSTDDQARALADNQTGVLSGCAVSPHTGSDMNVAIAAGVVAVAGVVVVVSAVTSLAVSAASTTDRRDIVTVNSSGVVSVTAGAAGSTAGWSRSSTGLPSVKPTIPASSVLLAEVYVEGSGATATTAIATGNIIDKTLIIPNPLSYTAAATSTQAVTTTTATVVTGLTTPTLQAGVYELAVTITLGNGTTAETITAFAAMGSGTATGLPAIDRFFAVSSRDSIVLTGTFTVTSAGPLNIQVQQGTTQTVTIQNATVNGAKAGATSISVNAY